MTRRWAVWSGPFLGILLLGTIGVALAQPGPPPGAQAPGRAQEFRNMPPPERQRILEDFQRWNELPEARRRELQTLQRFQQLPPGSATRS
jgi:hypothetical protein